MTLINHLYSKNSNITKFAMNNNHCKILLVIVKCVCFQYTDNANMDQRTAEVERNTLETQIKIKINLDGSGKASFSTGVPFLEHMLDQIARHGLIDMEIDGQRRFGY